MGVTSESLRKRHEAIDAFKTQHSIKNDLCFQRVFELKHNIISLLKFPI